MGFLDTLLGRSKPARPDLDRLFALPTAAITLEAATGFTPTGLGSVCFRAAEGGAFAQIQSDVRQLLDSADGSAGGGALPVPADEAGRLGPVEFSTDDYGYTWMLARHNAADLSGLVTDLHAVNSSLESTGFGPHLLCSLAAFEYQGRALALVYLYKRGTFYPFAPLPTAPGATVAGGGQRDNALELQVKGAIGVDLPFEEDLSRWFPLWGAPGL